ncbi:uncharacterized protein METZ01_LOCUS52978, partial [marine metagenome]
TRHRGIENYLADHLFLNPEPLTLKYRTIFKN